MTETQYRFLKAIAERIPEDRIVEVRLFPAIRQGGVESGVAVVATEVLPEPAPLDATSELPADAEPAAEAVGEPLVEVVEETPEVTEDGAHLTEGAAAASMATEHVTTSVIAPDVVASSGRQRYAVHSARYRLALKGPDRGKWEFDIVHQADAPLDTVERVVRGVAHRAGEEGEAETFTAAELHTALSQPWWNTEP